MVTQRVPEHEGDAGKVTTDDRLGLRLCPGKEQQECYCVNFHMERPLQISLRFNASRVLTRFAIAGGFHLAATEAVTESDSYPAAFPFAVNVELLGLKVSRLTPAHRVQHIVDTESQLAPIRQDFLLHTQVQRSQTTDPINRLDIGCIPETRCLRRPPLRERERLLQVTFKSKRSLVKGFIGR